MEVLLLQTNDKSTKEFKIYYCADIIYHTQSHQITQTHTRKHTQTLTDR